MRVVQLRRHVGPSVGEPVDTVDDGPLKIIYHTPGVFATLFGALGHVVAEVTCDVAPAVGGGAEHLAEEVEVVV